MGEYGGYFIKFFPPSNLFRAILVRRDEIRLLSSEFTPETERQRIQQLAFTYPELLAGEFTRLEFPRRLKGDDLGQKVLFRDHHMRGW